MKDEPRGACVCTDQSNQKALESAESRVSLCPRLKTLFEAVETRGGNPILIFSTRGFRV